MQDFLKLQLLTPFNFKAPTLYRNVWKIIGFVFAKLCSYRFSNYFNFLLRTLLQSAPMKNGKTVRRATSTRWTRITALLPRIIYAVFCKPSDSIGTVKRIGRGTAKRADVLFVVRERGVPKEWVESFFLGTPWLSSGRQRSPEKGTASEPRAKKEKKEGNSFSLPTPFRQLRCCP